MKKQKCLDRIYQFLLERKEESVLFGPAPTKSDLKKILVLAEGVQRVGAHKLRFIPIRGKKKVLLGAAIADSMEIHANRPLTELERLGTVADTLSSPLTVIVVYEGGGNKDFSFWAALCDAANASLMIELGARSLGYGAQWRPLHYAPAKGMRELLQMTADEQALGVVAIGHACS